VAQDVKRAGRDSGGLAVLRTQEEETNVDDELDRLLNRLDD
jgi:hypothetical protein